MFRGSFKRQAYIRGILQICAQEFPHGDLFISILRMHFIESF